MKSSGTGEYCYYVGVPMDYGETNPYGKASGSYNLTTLYMLSFDEDDLRRDVTCVNYSYDAKLNQKAPTIGDNNLGRIKNGKYRRIWMETPLGATTTKSTGVNASYMRYADILLMYAEAANENNNGPTQGAKDALKEVRKRAFPSDKWAEKVDAYVDALTTKEQFLKLLLMKENGSLEARISAILILPDGIFMVKFWLISIKQLYKWGIMQTSLIRNICNGAMFQTIITIDKLKILKIQEH